MNPDERFEERLCEIARTRSGDGPTTAWKAEILAVAMEKGAPSRRLTPPRPLLIAWAVAWMAITLLSWPQPDAEDTDPPLVTAPAAPAAPVSLLFANRSELHQQLNLP
jgi:hypothetical protein